jgi:hypothetical protein
MSPQSSLALCHMSSRAFAPSRHFTRRIAGGMFAGIVLISLASASACAAAAPEPEVHIEHNGPVAQHSLPSPLARELVIPSWLFLAYVTYCKLIPGTSEVAPAYPLGTCTMNDAIDHAVIATLPVKKTMTLSSVQLRLLPELHHQGWIVSSSYTGTNTIDQINRLFQIEGHGWTGHMLIFQDRGGSGRGSEVLIALRKQR